MENLDDLAAWLAEHAEPGTYEIEEPPGRRPRRKAKPKPKPKPKPTVSRKRPTDCTCPVAPRDEGPRCAVHDLWPWEVKNPEPAKWKRDIAREGTRRAQAERTARIRELRAELKTFRATRAKRLQYIRKQCRLRRAELREQHKRERAELTADAQRQRAELAEQIKAARAQQTKARRDQRAAQKAKCAERVDRLNRAMFELRKAIGEEQRYRRALADTRRRSPSVTKAERRSESDDAVEANLPPDLVSLWREHRRAFKATARRSRTEAFLEWAERSPEAVLAAQADAADADVERMIREHERELSRLQRRANPTKAEDAFEAFHWGRRPRRKLVADVPPLPAEAFELGKVISITYEATKGRQHAAWEHDFGEPRPTLAADPEGEQLLILGGGYRVTDRGIEG